MSFFDITYFFQVRHFISYRSTTGILNQVKASAYESESIGHGALEALGSQHEVLIRSNEKVEEVKTNANMSKQLLRVFSRVFA